MTQLYWNKANINNIKHNIEQVYIYIVKVKVKNGNMFWDFDQQRDFIIKY